MFLELGDAHVGDAVVQHLAAHAAHLDDVAHDDESPTACPGPCGAVVSTIGVLGLPRISLTASLSIMPLVGLSSILRDQVARHDARARGRGVFDGRDDLDAAVFAADLDAQAAELALRLALHFLERVGVQVGGMRVEVADTCP